MKIAIVAMGGSSRVWFDRVYTARNEKTNNQTAFNAISSAVQPLTEDDEALFHVVKLAELVGSKMRAGHGYDEVWAVNAMGVILRDYDKILHMDDLSATGWDFPKDIPIITSSPRHPYNCEIYPINEVVNEFKSMYFNNSIAYGIALAMYRGATRIGLFGCDFAPHDGIDAKTCDAGASCVEYWLREAENRGVSLEIPHGCRLMGMNTDQRLYGYSNQPVLKIGNALMRFDNGWKHEIVHSDGGPQENDGAETPEDDQSAIQSFPAAIAE